MLTLFSPLSRLSDDAFLLSEPHVTAMFQCLEAVEQNNPKLLAQVDTVGVGFLTSCTYHLFIHEKVTCANVFHRCFTQV